MKHILKQHIFLLSFLTILLAICCATQSYITGEPSIYGVDKSSGRILERDILATSPPKPSPQSPAERKGSEHPETDATPARVSPAIGDIITITADTIFIKRLAEIGNPHVLVYAEIFPDGTDDPKRAFTRVLFEQKNQPANVFLGVTDRVLYGPAVYNGLPIRIKMYIVELDKEDKEKGALVLDKLGTLSQFAPTQASLPISLALDIAKLVNAMNEDDYELRFDFTLHPQESVGTYSLNPAFSNASSREGKPFTYNTSLREGSYAILKRELPQRGAELNEVIGYEWDNPVQDKVYGLFKSPQTQRVLEGPFAIQAGRIYRVIEKAYEFNNGQKGSLIDISKPTNQFTIGFSTGVNKGTAQTIELGTRLEVRDQTYVILSTTIGAKGGVALTESQLRGDSDLAATRIGELLEDASAGAKDFNQRIEAVAATAGEIFEQRRLAVQVANRVGNDSQLRSTPQYILLWTQSLLPEPDSAGTGTKEDEIQVRNRRARNSAIINVMAANIVNFPIVDSTNEKQIKALAKLEAGNLSPEVDRPGRFRLSSDFLSSFPR